jgi:hypothetical protein
MSRILIKSFGVTGFRSFDSKLQPLSDLQRINLFVGRNNSGKSNVIAALRLYCASVGRDSEYSELRGILGDPLNTPLAKDAGQPLLWTPFEDDVDRLFPEIQNYSYQSRAGYKSLQSDTRELLANLKDRLCTDGFIPGRPGESKARIESTDLVGENGALLLGDPEVYQQLFNRFSGYQGGGPRDWSQFLLQTLDPFRKLGAISFVEIPSVRKIIDAGTAFDGTFGSGKLIDTIAQWERPDIGDLVEHAEKFRRLLHFAQTVLEDARVQIQIPHRRDTIHVIKDGKTLPIQRLGTGVHQVIMLAAAATIIEDSAVAIEEPETNLHPSLQRKLIAYLNEQTSNQYFVTTHSGHILEAAPAAVFQVSLVDGVTRVRRVGSPSDRFQAVEDLGYHASDLIQTPAVVWVEGPSDRIYLTAWLKALNPALVEGTHYSVMFYGGRLLSHLSANDPEVEGFISLRRLNRYVVVLMDSDRKRQGERINATKSRLVEEIERTASCGYAWVTDGREIENYLDERFVSETVREMTTDFAALPSDDVRFRKVLQYTAQDGSTKSVEDKKVPFARKYVETSEGQVPSHTKLAGKLAEVVKVIRRANGM